MPAEGVGQLSGSEAADEEELSVVIDAGEQALSSLSICAIILREGLVEAGFTSGSNDSGIE